MRAKKYPDATHRCVNPSTPIPLHHTAATTPPPPPQYARTGLAFAAGLLSAFGIGLGWCLRFVMEPPTLGRLSPECLYRAGNMAVCPDASGSIA